VTQYTNTDEKPEPQKPQVKVPDDFEDEAEFLAHMRENYAADEQADQLNRDAGVEDLKFFVSDQWDEGVRARREKARKPVLTIDRLNAFVAQIVGNRRLNETTIKIVPDNGGTEAVARVREGLVRSIQKISRADIAYDTTMLNTAVCGIGNFQCYLDYESDDVFEQKICIAAIPNAFAVVWDRMAVDPTGSDAGHVFVIDTLPREYFKQKYPWAQPSDVSLVATSTTLPVGDWVTDDNVRVVSYWRMRTRKRTLALMNTGATLDITDDDSPETMAAVVARPDGSPIMREVDRKYAEMYLCSGSDILEGPYELQISRVPVFRVPAWEAWVGDTRHRWGLVRKMKDAQRQHNYMRSAIMEKIMQTPRAVWTASAEAIAGREKAWRNSHLSDDPVLVYNGDAAQPPQRVPPAQVEQAMLEMSEMTTQDLKDVSNIHEANLGMPSNEVSGVAIQARQRVSDTGTVIYHDNLNQAIEQCGMVVNELIPAVYDTPRVIKVLGEDARQDLQTINDMDNPKSVDITSGKYSVSVVTGPSYQTKRVEATQSMMAFINAAPQVAGYTLDLIAKSMDWPGADEFVRRIRLMLPPGMVDPRDMTPDLQQRAKAMAEQGQKQQQLQEAAALTELQKTQSEVALNTARAKNFTEEAGAQQQRIQNESIDVASRSMDRDLRGQLEAVKVAAGS
jgi:hypothetical protein